MNKIIEIRNLNKSFGNIKAVNDLSFDVAEGELRNIRKQIQGKVERAFRAA